MFKSYPHQFLSNNQIYNMTTTNSNESIEETSYKKVISDSIFPEYFGSDLDFRVKFYSKKDIVIPKFSTMIVETNIYINKIRKYNIYIKSRHKMMKTTGFLKTQNYRDKLKVKIVNDQNCDITLSKNCKLGYIIGLPFMRLR